MDGQTLEKRKNEIKVNVGRRYGMSPQANGSVLAAMTAATVVVVVVVVWIAMKTRTRYTIYLI